MIQPQQQQINIALKDMDQFICTSCGNKTFDQSLMLFKVSALLSPNGQESIYPVPVFQCTNCHQILPDTLPDLS